MAPTVKKLNLGPVPRLPEKSNRKRLLSSPILTGERAKRQLEAQEKRKQERERPINKKLLDEEVCDDYEEDLDEGYHQYMAM